MFEMTPCILSDHQRLRLDFSNKRNNRKQAYSSKQINSIPQLSHEHGRTNEINGFLQFNENEDMAFQNL